MKFSRTAYGSLVLLSSLFILFGCAHHAVSTNQNGITTLSDAPAQPSATPKTATADDATVPALASLPETTDPSQTEAAPVVPPQGDKSAPIAKKENGDEEQANLDTALELTETAQEYWEDGDSDQAIEALDQAYALILKVPANNPKLSQQKEDLRFVISKRIMEMYASRKMAATGTSDEIPRTMNAHVEREIQSFQTQERDFFLES